uniref:Uncharacterized protein n=1 Tax=Pundamilia nyererei TaxID=303518 RepID=A0A3B4FMW5_9CICH
YITHPPDFQPPSRLCLTSDVLIIATQEMSDIKVFKVYKMFSSFQARDRKVVGDMDGARRYGSIARCLNIISTIIVATVFLAHFKSFNFLKN